MLIIRGLAIVAGLLCAALAQWLAFLMAGAGHGWVAPFFFSHFLFLLYPLAFLRRVTNSGSLGVDATLVSFGVILDIVLLFMTVSGEAQYFMRVVSLSIAPMIWILLWGLWQVVAVSSLLARKRRRDAELYGGNIY